VKKYLKNIQTHVDIELSELYFIARHQPKHYFDHFCF